MKRSSATGIHSLREVVTRLDTCFFMCSIALKLEAELITLKRAVHDFIARAQTTRAQVSNINTLTNESTLLA